MVEVTRASPGGMGCTPPSSFLLIHSWHSLEHDKVQYIHTYIHTNYIYIYMGMECCTERVLDSHWYKMPKVKSSIRAWRSWI